MRFIIRLNFVAIFIALPIVGQSAGFAQSLRQEAQKLGLQVGAAVDPARFSEPLYAETVANQFNMVEPENAMKWPATEPARGQFSFAAGDQVVEFAEAHQMKVRGHNLLWGISNPAWLTEGHFTPDQLRSIMKNHIITVVSHYRGKVFAWDVVNEAFDRDGRLKHTLWYDRPGIGLAGRGTAYLAQAFRWAHQADPNALLFYNDYAAEGLNAKSDAIYAMVKDFKRRHVPIDGVGLQMHLMDLNQIPTSVAANIARLAALGVQVHITEMDVALPVDAGGKPLHRADLSRQAKIYGEMATLCAEQPGCTAFQTWGFTDKYSWIPHYTKGKKGDGLLFDSNYHPKPAYRAVLKAFKQAAKKHPTIIPQRLQIERHSSL
jgi:endo-1,4-beta-xylanase